jgi:hypothetical protein
MALHDSEELNNNLRGRPDKDLALAAALGIDDVVLCVCQHAWMYHRARRRAKQSFYPSR